LDNSQLVIIEEVFGSIKRVLGGAHLEEIMVRGVASRKLVAAVRAAASRGFASAPEAGPAALSSYENKNK
jgi:hypothetical protein